MPRLSWNELGQRFFETGVDQGVLYVGSAPGVAWTGLISVSESPSGGDPKPYYIDGVKYLNIASFEEYEATINAFHSPPEFGPCDGVYPIQNGLLATQQPRKSFGLSYRTKLGNDIDGPDHAYKIHLVYNALAAPSTRNNNTLGGQTDPTTFGWAITTKPPAITGYKRTAHLIIESNLTDPGVLTEIEDLIYGSEANQPQLPTPDELIAIFS